MIAVNAIAAEMDSRTDVNGLLEKVACGAMVGVGRRVVFDVGAGGDTSVPFVAFAVAFGYGVDTIVISVARDVGTVVLIVARVPFVAFVC